MIYFRGYQLRTITTPGSGEKVYNKFGEVLRGVTPKTVIVMISNPADPSVWGQCSASALTSCEARRKALFAAKRKFLTRVKSLKPCIAKLSDGTYRVTVTWGEGRVSGYGSTPEEATQAAHTTRFKMDEVITDIVEPKKKKGLFTRFIQFIKN